MDCLELQESLAEVEDGSGAEQQAHLRSCPACTALVKELDLIIAAAGELQGADEPSPRVWNSIEIALRQEGVIHPQREGKPLLPSFVARWGAARWLVPAAAMLLLAVGIYVRRESQPQRLAQEPAVAGQMASVSDPDDDAVIQEVALHAPTLKTQYEENLRQVNQSIRDAQSAVDENPNDEDTRRSLMDAYQQKSMLFEMAMDRPLP
jgi:hypothetical protein